MTCGTMPGEANRLRQNMRTQLLGLQTMAATHIWNLRDQRTPLACGCVKKTAEKEQAPVARPFNALHIPRPRRHIDDLGQVIPHTGRALGVPPRAGSRYRANPPPPYLV